MISISLLTTNRKSYRGVSKNPFWTLAMTLSADFKITFADFFYIIMLFRAVFLRKLRYLELRRVTPDGNGGLSC